MKPFPAPQPVADTIIIKAASGPLVPFLKLNESLQGNIAFVYRHLRRPQHIVEKYD
jgi:hypothetical protein